MDLYVVMRETLSRFGIESRTVHGIYKTRQEAQEVIDFEMVDEPYDYIYIAEVVMGTYYEWGLNND